jgi:hypothetical protein
MNESKSKRISVSKGREKDCCCTGSSEGKNIISQRAKMLASQLDYWSGHI